MIDATEFIRLELERSGRTSYTLEEVERLVVQFREQKAAATDEITDAEVDRLLFGERSVSDALAER